jgi:hypothetical protein
MSVPLITEANTSPGESAHMAAELARAGLRVLQTLGTRVPAYGASEGGVLVPL